MTHDSTWFGGTRAMRRGRLTAPVGFLLACVLFAALPAAASATTEMRGEWEIAVTAGSKHLTGKGVITQEANSKGEFSDGGFLFEGIDPGTFSGTLNGGEALVKVVIAAAGPFPEAVFTGNLKVETIAGLLTISGPATVVIGTAPPESGSVLAKRIKTQLQIEEQEQREKEEREEREARQNIRGEWALTLKAGPQTSQGVAVITQAANTKNEFASSSALFQGIVPGAFSGTLKGGEASVTVTSEAYGPVPTTRFTSSTMKVEPSGSSLSMSGSGTITIGAEPPVPATLTATRTKTYQEVVARETAERVAKEKEAQEAAEKAARELKEKELKELKERQEREAREAAEKAAAVKSAQITPITVTNPALVSVLLATKTLTVGNSGAISLNLTNPNASAAHGQVKLTLAKAGKASSVKAGKSTTLGEGSFSIAAHGAEVVKLKLSQSGRKELAHRKTLHVVVTLTTEAGGQPNTGKTFSLTLHAAKSAHGKH